MLPVPAGLRCGAAELALRITPLRRGVVEAMEEHVRLRLLGCHISPPARRCPLPLQSGELHSLGHDMAGDEVLPPGRLVRALLSKLVQELLKSGPEFTALAEGQRLHPARLPLSLLCVCGVSRWGLTTSSACAYPAAPPPSAPPTPPGSGDSCLMSRAADAGAPSKPKLRPASKPCMWRC